MCVCVCVCLCVRKFVVLIIPSTHAYMYTKAYIHNIRLPICMQFMQNMAIMTCVRMHVCIKHILSHGHALHTISSITGIQYMADMTLLKTMCGKKVH